MCYFSEYDEVARRNGYSADILTQIFTLKDVEKFLYSLGVSEIDVQDDYLICPTICHNPIDQAESMKLYYYDKTKNFHCYTQCSENFNIITLYQRYMELNHQAVSYDEAIYYLRQFISFEDDDEHNVTPQENTSYKIDEPLEQKSIITLLWSNVWSIWCSIWSKSIINPNC